MKLTIITPTDERITRYGVSDFQINDSEVTLFYSVETTRATDAPEEEQFKFTELSGVDSECDTDATYYEEDLMHEEQTADDLEDYRLPHQRPNP